MAFGNKKKGRRSTYLLALHHLFEGNHTAAIEGLKKTVKDDSDNIMAYIILGDLLREQGMPQKAIKIHRNLLIRTDLTDTEIDTVLQRLIQDYQQDGQTGRATETAEKLSRRNRKSLGIQKQLLSLYMATGHWDKAFQHRQIIDRAEKNKNSDIHALFKVQAGLKQVELGEEREGRLRYREAIKLDKKCAPAYLYLGDSYRRVGRHEDAEKIWRDLTLKAPEAAHLVFDRLKDVLFDLGRFSDMEPLLETIIKKRPKNEKAIVQLGKLLYKQGKLDTARTLCQKALDINPDNAQARHLQVLIMKDLNQESSALNAAITLLESQMAKNTLLACQECGYQVSDPLWHCPQCGAWKSFGIE